jgi:hypothetical protein
MTRPKARLARSVRMAEACLAAAYFDACDDAQRAVDPAEVTPSAWAQACLAEAYEIARAIEVYPQPWSIARSILMRPLPTSLQASAFTNIQYAA